MVGLASFLGSGTIGGGFGCEPGKFVKTYTYWGDDPNDQNKEWTGRCLVKCGGATVEVWRETSSGGGFSTGGWYVKDPACPDEAASYVGDSKAEVVTALQRGWTPRRTDQFSGRKVC